MMFVPSAPPVFHEDLFQQVFQVPSCMPLSAVCKLPFSSYSGCLLPNYQGHQNREVSFNHENLWQINIVDSG